MAVAEPGNPNYGMPPLSRLERTVVYVVLVIKTIRHPRRAARRAWEIIRRVDEDGL